MTEAEYEELLAPRCSSLRRFIRTFIFSKGATEIVLITALSSLGAAGVVGLIPDTITDRYARLHHGYTGEPCSDFDRLEKPPGCQAGAEEAQGVASYANVALSILSLLCNPVVGSFSDVYGRRWLIIASLFLSTLPAVVFVVLLQVPTTLPTWYFAATSVVGSIYYTSLAFCSLADTIPEKLLAPAYGLMLASSYGGYAIAPCLPLLLSPYGVAMSSLLLTVGALVIALTMLPETLPEDIRKGNLEQRLLEGVPRNMAAWTWHVMTSPVTELSILNKDWIIRLVTVASFLSSMVAASDDTLVVYYIEDELNVRDTQIAAMYFWLGVAGIVVDGILIEPLVEAMGEKRLLVCTFVTGVVYNLLYGIAKRTTPIYCGMMLAQFARANFPLLSSLASKDASQSEQGRIQGAVCATNSIGYALGPLSMVFVYNRTKDNALGPGFMFIYAAALYAVGTVVVTLIPVRVGLSTDGEEPNRRIDNDDLVEPLLADDAGVNGAQDDETDIARDR